MNPNENNLLPPDPAPSLDSSAYLNSTPSSSPAGPSTPDMSHPMALSVAAEDPPPANNSISEDIRVPWGWTDLVLFVVLAVAGFILISLFVGLALAVSGANFHRVQNNPHDINLLSIFIQVLVDLGLVAYLAAQMRLRFHSPFWHTIGWCKPDTGRVPPVAFYSGLILSGFFLSLIVSLGSSVFPPQKNLPIETLFQDRYATVLFMSVAVLLAPLVEETIFRGYIYPVVARSFGKVWGILATGTLFGLLHASQLWGGWSQIALLVFVGVVLTFARAVSRTVVTSFVIHTSYNSVQVIGLLVATHGLRHLPGAF
jgi:membrane protease YdiL (CAAX protease family)